MRTLLHTARIIPAFAALLMSAAAVETVVAQAPPEPTARNAVYFEMGGNALAYSLNYDRRFRNAWTGRVGLMGLSVSGQDISGNRIDADLVIMPLTINALVGGGAHRLELGVGPLFAFAGGEYESVEVGDVEDFSATGLAGVTSVVGYRRQPLDGGFLFRVGLTPFYSDGFQMWGGLSVGWSF